VQAERLHPCSVARVVKRCAERAGFDPVGRAAAIAAAGCGDMAAPSYGAACDPQSCDGFPEDASRADDVGVVVHLDAGADARDAADGDGAVVVPDANDGGPPLDSAGDVADANDGD
jgi:hypothetical protein